MFSLSNNFVTDRSVTTTDHERYHPSATSFAAAAGDSSGSISTSPSSATSSLAYTTNYPNHYTAYAAPVAPVQHFVNHSGLSGRILDDPTQGLAAWRSPAPALGHSLSPSTTSIATRDYVHTGNLPNPSHLSSPPASTYTGYSETPRSLTSIATPLSPSSNPLLSAQMASLSTTGYGTHRSECQNFPWVQHESFHNLECEGQEVVPRIHAKMEKGFFLSPDRSWTCYRRNYFSVTCSFELTPHIGNGRLCLNGQRVQAMGMKLTAAVDGQTGKGVELIQHTPKRDRGPKNAIPIIKISPTPPNGRPAESTLSPHGVYHVPMSSFHATGVPTGPHLPFQNTRDDSPASSRSTSPTGRRHEYTFGHLASSQLPMPGQNIQHTFERVQFKSATANNGKRRASQQYFHLMVELWVDVREDETRKPKWVKIACAISDKVVVRGRSPSHYKAENQGGGSSSTGRGGSTGGYGNSSGSYGGLSRGSFSGTGYATGPGNTGGFRASQQYQTAASPEQGYSSSAGSSVAEAVDMKHNLEAEATHDEDITMQDFAGYQYIPTTLYDGVSVQGKADSPNTTSGAGQTGDKKFPLRDEYPEALPGSQWSMGNCNRFQGVESSRGYYPAFSTTGF
ncbi:p53-like transcription factor, partial [Aureobasidium melanogenum]